MYHKNIAQIIEKTIYNNPYIPINPYPRQLWPVFEVNKPLVDNEANEILVGAGGFGGKTYLGSMLAAQYLSFPQYSCLVTRLNYAELTGEDSIWENLINWTCDENRLGDLACKPNESRLRIKAPTGAKIWFKAFDREQKKQKVKSESYDRIVNDEASELEQVILQFLFRSLRSPKDAFIPLSMINLSNPGGPSTDYLCEKYVDGVKNYYPLDWRHNPFINQDVYSKTLDNLDFVDKKYQKEGDWHYRPSRGDLFKEQDLLDIIITKLPERRIVRNVRGVDMAITKKGDRSAFFKWYRDERGHAYIMDVKTARTKYPENNLLDIVEEDNPQYNKGIYESELIFEYEAGSAAIHQERFIKDVLKEHIRNGLRVRFTRNTTNKFTRARPMANAIKNLNVSILKGKWNRDLIDEFKDFGPDDKEYDHDDIVDAGSISYNHIFKPQTVLKPRRRRSRR